jgi:hypothetical protein
VLWESHPYDPGHSLALRTFPELPFYQVATPSDHMYAMEMILSKNDIYVLITIVKIICIHQ